METTLKINTIRVNVYSILPYAKDPCIIRDQLGANIAKFPYFANQAVIVDLWELESPTKEEIDSILRAVSDMGLKILGLRHVDKEWAEVAQSLGVNFYPALPSEMEIAARGDETPEPIGSDGDGDGEDGDGRPGDDEGDPDREEDAGDYEEEDEGYVWMRPPLVIDRPVRSGQQYYAERSDLIVNAVVNEGAEIIADGNIHCYSIMRGRALAGASGDPGARIFILNMQAQLVSVAGVYRTFDSQLPSSLNRKPVLISLTQDNRLAIRSLTGADLV